MVIRSWELSGRVAEGERALLDRGEADIRNYALDGYHSQYSVLQSADTLEITL